MGWWWKGLYTLGHGEVVEEIVGWIQLRLVSQSCQHQGFTMNMDDWGLILQSSCCVGTQSISCIELKRGIYTREQVDISATLRLDGLKSPKQKHIKLYASIDSTIVTIYFPDIYSLIANVSCF